MSDEGKVEIEVKEGKKVPVTTRAGIWQDRTQGVYTQIADKVAAVGRGMPDETKTDLCKTSYDAAGHAWLQSRTAEMFMRELVVGSMTVEDLGSLRKQLAEDVRRRAGEMTEEEFRSALAQSPELGSGREFSSRDMTTLNIGERVDVLRVVESACVNILGEENSSDQVHQSLMETFAGGSTLVGEHNILTKILTSK
jgi:hypothetical protein